MQADHRARLLAALETDGTEALEPALLAHVRRVVADPGVRVVVRPHGTLVVHGVPDLGRSLARTLEVDRRGTIVSVLAWTEDGRLRAAFARLPDRSWIGVEAGAMTGWGVCDRLHRMDRARLELPPGGAALTVFEPLEWAAIDRIPTLADPRKLPPGAGSAILNVVAALAGDQGQGSLRYHGPYPTEQLFLSLLEMFRYEGEPPDPLGEFLAGRLGWHPAPHERVFEGGPGGPCVQLRDGVERVFHEGVSYWRAEWQSVRRHAPRRVRERDTTTIACSLCALDTVIADRVLLTTAGELIGVVPAARTGEPARPLPSAVWPGVVATVTAGSAPPLAPFIRAAADRFILVWSDLERDLVTVDEDRVSVSSRLRAALGRRLATAATRRERLGLALATVTELARLVGDHLRAAAQERMLALPEAEQRRALARVEASADEEPAVRITTAVEALLDEVAVPSAPRAG